MISSVLAMLLLAPSPQAIVTARRDYSACLSNFRKEKSKDKLELAAFETGLATACAAKEQQLRSAIVAVDTAAGIKRAVAEQGAGDEVEMLRENVKELFLNENPPAPKS
jgi:hypothetical protein